MLTDVVVPPALVQVMRSSASLLVAAICPSLVANSSENILSSSTVALYDRVRNVDLLSFSFLLSNF